MSYNPFHNWLNAQAQAAQQAMAAQQGNVAGYVGEFAPYPGGYGYQNQVAGLDIVGASQYAQNMGMQRAAAMAGNQVPRPPAGVFHTGDMAIPRRKVAGMPQIVVPPSGTQGESVLLPKEVLRIERIVIACPELLPLETVTVDSITVGTQEQNVGTGPIPATIFNSLAFDTLLQGNTLNPGIPFSLKLTLLVPNAQVATRFNIAIIGSTIQV
jgi:hypothetical protein